jgi:hypothetical protein
MKIGGDDECKKNIFETGNESARSYYEIWPFGRLIRHDSAKILGFRYGLKCGIGKSNQVNTLPKAKSKTRSKQNKDMLKCSSVYSERGVPLPVLTSGGE